MMPILVPGEGRAEDGGAMHRQQVSGDNAESSVGSGASRRGRYRIRADKAVNFLFENARKVAPEVPPEGTSVE
jgi:hypothetical protein